MGHLAGWSVLVLSLFSAPSYSSIQIPNLADIDSGYLGSYEDAKLQAYLIQNYLLNDEYFESVDSRSVVNPSDWVGLTQKEDAWMNFLEPQDAIMVDREQWQFNESLEGWPAAQKGRAVSDFPNIEVIVSQDQYSYKHYPQQLGTLVDSNTIYMVLGEIQAQPVYDKDFYRVNFCESGTPWGAKLIFLNKDVFVHFTVYSSTGFLVLQHSDPPPNGSSGFTLPNFNHPQQGSKLTMGVIPHFYEAAVPTRYMILFQRNNSLSEESASDCLR